MAQFLFKRSGTADKRPDPAQMALGEVDLNYNATTGGLFYKDSAGTLIKVGPAEVGTNPPNASPVGSSGNAVGEFWYNTGDGFLYIWDGSTWNTTAPGVGLASPTVPGVVYGLTDDTSLNVALGKGSGSNITTGTCNVALGPNVAVASATGDCQLAIGYSATANWLTGDSTKAIKPGAGIIDCADSTGTAGQVLMSDGSNAICWGNPAASSPATPTVYGTVLGFTNDALFNTALGEGALIDYATITGERNTFVGAYSGSAGLTTASCNTGVGQGTFGALISGCSNTAVGESGTLSFLTSGCNNSAFGAGALSCATTGSCNLALGALAGCVISTGSQNVAIGPNAQVASATGDCQLAIGFSSTANWLTGNSTKAIKPGAGIIDCNDSTGTAGQALLSDGANAVVWGSTGISPDLLCCQNIAGCGALGGNLIYGGYSDGNISPSPLYPGEAGQILQANGGLNGISWQNANYVCGACFTKGAIPVGCAQVGGGMATVSCLNQNNPGKPPGYYANVPVGGGSGTGATVNVNIINVGYFPAVDSVEVASPGTGYLVGDSGLTMTIDGTTLTTTLTVTSLNSNTVANYSFLPVGTNGQVLTADSACTNGVKWAAAGGGGASPATPTVAGTVLGLTDASNTAIGCNALNVTLTGTDNVATGLCALFAVTGGLGNAAVGNFAAAGTTTGCYNVAMGLSALRSNTSGTRNVALGENAGRGNTTGCFNVAVGSAALCGTSSGTDNTAVGYQALLSNTTCVGNTAVGSLALNANTVSCNTAVGLNALRTNSTGLRNTAVGAQALCANSTGNDNTSLGFCAGISVTGNSNTLIGSLSGRQLAGASANVAVGRNSLCTASTGSSNTAVGTDAMLSMGTGQSNTAVGSSVLGSATGSNNVAIGAFAGCNLTTGASNVAIGCGVTLASATGNCQLAIGFASGCNWLTGDNTKAIRPGAGIVDCAGSCGTNGQILASNGANAVCWVSVSGVSAATPSISGSVFGCADTVNAAIGSGVFAARTTGGCNSALGLSAFPALTTGCYNIALGDSGGSTITTGCYNITIGSGVTVPNATGSCQLAIGAQSGSLWLTGDSTLAIKPGAGIIDCTGSCGTAGQYLCSTGSNNVVWSTPVNPWVTAAAFEAPVNNGAKICLIGWPSEDYTTWSGQMSIATTYDNGTDAYWIPGSNAIIMMNGYMGGGTNTVQAFNTSTGTFAVEGVAYGSQSDITVTFTPSISAVRMNFYIGYMDLSLTGNPGFGLLTTNVTQFTPPVANPNI